MSDKTTCLAIYVAEQRAVDEDREYTYGAIVFHIHIDHVINILRDICRIKVDGFNGNLTFCLVQNTSIQDKQGKPNGQWHIGTEEPPDILCRRLTGSEYTVQGSFPGYVQYSINEVIDMFSWGVFIYAGNEDGQSHSHSTHSISCVSKNIYITSIFSYSGYIYT